MNFAKKLFLGSVVAMGAFGLAACGSDSSSNASDNNETVDIDSTNNAANITFSDGASRVSGDTLRFNGIYKLNFVDATNENSSNLTFKNISFEVMNSAQTKVNATILTNPDFVPSANEINLNSMYSVFVRIALTDPAFTDCDDYSLVVKVLATDGVSEYPRTDVIAFHSEAKTNFFCKTAEPESSSSSATEPVSNEIPMVSCEVDVSTNVKPGIDLANCAALEVAQSDAADILFTKVTVSGNSEVVVTSNTGTLFTPITNSDKLPSTDDYEVDFWPEDVNNRSAYVSDFHFKTIAGDKIENLIENAAFIYIAKTTAYNATTGAGFYPFAVTKYSENNHKHFNMTIKIYKVQ